tara:strand:- start:370 stop:684 length:315 start_codon:yes stop_codon:yes gene_type:complete
MLNSICDLFSDREKQLEIQEKQDKILLDNFDKCPLVMFKLLLLERELNRNQLKSNNTTNIFAIINNTKNNIEKIDSYQAKLHNVLNLSNDKLCSNLEKFTKDYT